MAKQLNRPTPSSPPGEADLHDTALRHLARYAATRAGLLRVLERRITRWQRAVSDPPDPRGTEPADDATLPQASDPDTIAASVAQARAAAAAVVERLAASGVLDDAAFAEGRARGLVRAGVSRRVATARLAAKGVDVDLARAALPEDADTELASALVLARKRRIGPFRAGDADPARRQRELAILARAGFPQPLARQALAMDPEEAESRIIALRR
jgi:regulatory protein